MPADPSATPEPDILSELHTVLASRAAHAPAGSYSATLLADSELARRKVMEEAFEVCLELGRDPIEVDRVASEAADLVFHLLAGLVGAGVGWDAVVAELDRRRGRVSVAAPAGSAEGDA